MRAATADCSDLGISTSGCNTPSTRVRMRRSFSSGSKWMSLARRLTARWSTWLTRWMIGASSSSDSVTSIFSGPAAAFATASSSMIFSIDCWMASAGSGAAAAGGGQEHASQTASAAGRARAESDTTKSDRMD